MTCTNICRSRRRLFSGVATVIAFLAVPDSRAQTPIVPPDKAFSQELEKYPGLLEEFGRLFEKLQDAVHSPAPRTDSHLLPLLPDSTQYYAAFPSYGEVAGQTLKVFRQELQDSAVLRDWWSHSKMTTSGPQFEDYLDKFAQLHQYLGNELVVSGEIRDKQSGAVFVAEVRKPGLKKFLQQMINSSPGRANPSVHVLDVQELSSLSTRRSTEQLLILVRPDFVIAAFDPITLRKFNSQLDQHSGTFASTEFEQRIAHDYHQGTTMLAAADLQRILRGVSPQTAQDPFIRQTGFADVKYLVWDHKGLGADSVSEVELSFNGPRRGAAAWLANSGPLNGFDFVSPKAAMAGSVLLVNPGQIFEEANQLSGPSSANPFANLAKFEKVLNVSIKDDLLGNLAGEVTAELDGATAGKPEWKVMLSVRDAARLQKTLSALLAATQFPIEQSNESGVTYYSLRVPSSQKPTEISYAFSDGYLIVAPSRAAVANAIHLHASGGSLAKNPKFLAALPPAHSRDASAMFYQNSLGIAGLGMAQVAPQFAQMFKQGATFTSPAVFCVYGDNSTIRQVSNGSGFDIGGVLVVAAIAIPNLLRSKIAANESSAVGSVRVVNVAQLSYATKYPQRQFAPTLAVLGVDAAHPNSSSAQRAGILDNVLGNESCIANVWCTKSGYHFRITANCKNQACASYSILATPIDASTGSRSFCSTNDGIIRFQTGPPLSTPPSAAECKSWPPIR
ncbi:MAG TPA: hypothetical protein VGI16_11965 [Candidatus Acidoferrum sp.]|jgi:type II secretory pathway pseudopilin PulG